MTTLAKKFFNRETNQWEPLYAVEGRSAYDAAKLHGYTGTEEEFNVYLSTLPDSVDRIDNIEEVLYNQHSDTTLISNITIFETKVLTDLTLLIKPTFDGKPLIPKSIVLKKNNIIISTDPTIETYTDSISESTTYNISAEVYPKVIKTATLNVNSYYPMYFGNSKKTVIVESDIIKLTKQPIKINPNGDITVEMLADTYLWLCIPSTMSILKVTSGGFDVPMEQEIVINVTGKTSYKCYRSSNSFIAGLFKGTIL